VPSWERRLLICLLLASAALLAVTLSGGSGRAHADAVAYLVNVTVRPGYNFASAEQALTYGHRICDKVSQGRRYADIIGDVDTDLATGDTYQASYLIDQAVNELCPALIWPLCAPAPTPRWGCGVKTASTAAWWSPSMGNLTESGKALAMTSHVCQPFPAVARRAAFIATVRSALSPSARADAEHPVVAKTQG
jgi:hypothetical protein